MASAEKRQFGAVETGSNAPTRCLRCGSLMVSERFYGHQEAFWGQRCISCGDIVDPIILENRNSMTGRPLRR